jgi:hypothetical protein
MHTAGEFNNDEAEFDAVETDHLIRNISCFSPQLQVQGLALCRKKGRWCMVRIHFASLAHKDHYQYFCSVEVAVGHFFWWYEIRRDN